MPAGDPQIGLAINEPMEILRKDHLFLSVAGGGRHLTG